MNHKKYIISYFLILINTFVIYGQVYLCKEKESHHPIDMQLYEIKDSLFSSGVDTTIIYSHWIYTNGFNGYGKVLWIENGKTYLLRLNYNKENSSVERDEIIKLNDKSVFAFFFENNLDTIKANPDKQEIRISHDGRNFFQIEWGKENHCFIVSNLIVQFNPDNKRIQLINMLKEQRTDAFIFIDGERIKD